MVKEAPSMDDCATSRMRFETPAKLDVATARGTYSSAMGEGWSFVICAVRPTSIFV
jgi:hypothetical protein